MLLYECQPVILLTCLRIKCYYLAFKGTNASASRRHDNLFMLHSIRIRNFAIIKDLLLDFKEGLNLLTGETGAGKSIIIDALEMLLGERSSSTFVRTGEEKAIVEGVFQACGASIEEILRKAGIQRGRELIIKREINASGGSKVFINGEMGTTNTLKLLGPIVVNIHGQHQHQSLLNLQAHLAFLDRFGNNNRLNDKIEGVSHKLIGFAREHQELREKLAQREQALDFLNYQVEEIEKCAPKQGEDEELSREREMLRNVETLRQIVSNSYKITYDDERSILSLLNQVKKNVEKLSEIEKGFQEHRSGLDEAIFSTEELSLFLRDYSDSLNVDPERLSFVEDRLAILERLKNKYGQTLGDVLAFKEQARERMKELNRASENLEAVEKKITDLYSQYRSLAQKLSKKRRQDAAQFSSSLLEQLKELAMDKSRFQVEFNSEVLPEQLDWSKEVFFSPEGADKVEFLISVNVGEELKPLAKVASGGELSRIMLAISALMKTQKDSKTLIFDEVDAGIGGKVASVVGKKLKAISQQQQVICVTHLPQIASYADHHIRVTKKIDRRRTVVHVSILNEEDKVKEIARMLAGEKISETSLRHAKEMVKSNGRRHL